MKKGILIFIVSMLAFSLMAAKLPVIGERYDAPPYQPTETAVLDEGFEGGVLPAGWTQEYVSGTFDWTYQNGGQSGNPGAAHTGSFNAFFFQGNYNNNTTKLITPQLNLSTLAAANLTFWHTQAVWSGDQDVLKVYYKDSSVASWTLLAEYLTDYSVWTEETIALPNLSNDYYIAFEAMGAYGYGVCLDDVVVDEAAAGVNYTIDLVDSYGDGWNGGMLDLSVNGVVVLDDITLLTGAGPETYTFAVEDGDFVEIFYTAGNWSYENEYYVYNNNGYLILSSGTAGATPNAYESFTVNLGTTPTPLNGTYVIDQLGAGDYLSFNDAVADLITQGIDGPVVFEVAAGTYYEQVVIPEIIGASATNTITFVGIDAVRQDAILTFEPFDNESRHIVKLTGAKHIRFDNLAVVVGATSTYGWPFHIMNDSQDIQILNSTISTLDNSTSSYYVPIVISNSATGATTGTSNVFDIVIDNNVIYGGYYGVSANGTSASPILGLEITNNLIAEGYYYGIRAYYTTSPLLNNNTIPMRSTGTTTTSGYGIYIYYVYDQFECSYNNITDMGQYGIYVYNATNPATDNPSLIVNNAIGGGFRNTGTTASGMYIASSENIGIYYNSINNDSSQGRAIYTLSSASLLNIRNNSFAFTGSGAGYAAYIQSSASLIANDYNNYYSGTSTNFVYYDANVADLAALQLVGIPVGNDANSLQGDPMYTGQYDLLPFGPQLSDAGTPIAGIDDDIVGNLRDLVTPCIGAYEFDPPTNPVLTVNPTSYDFGTVFLNATSNPQVFSMTNTGGGSMNISSVVLSGTNSDQFILTDLNTYPAVLNSGDAITIDVVFAPTSEGMKNAEITITDSRSRLVTVVPLSGTGYDATVTTFPYQEDFETFIVATNATGYQNDWSTSPANTASFFRWNVEDGPTSSSNTGPNVDHTTGTATGKYLFTEASNGVQFDEAYVYTPPFNITTLTNPVATFWYHMHGSGMGELHVDLWDGTNWILDVTPALIGQQQVNQADPWLERSINLTSYIGTTFSLRFRAIRGVDYYGDMAIDDFAILDASNPPGYAGNPNPPDGAIDIPVNGNLSWSSASLADGYYVSFGTDNPPTNILNGFDNGNNTSIGFTNLASATTHYWQIVPYNTTGSPANCPVWSFTTFDTSAGVLIGNAEQTWIYPFATYYMDTRLQTIYLSSEFGSGRTLESLKLNVATVPGQILENLYVRVKETADNTLTAFDNNDLVQIYHGTNITVTTGWFEIVFDTPFNYSGIDNLLLDICIDNSSYTTDGGTWAFTDTRANRSAYQRSDISAGNLLASVAGTPSNLGNQIIFTGPIYVDTPAVIFSEYIEGSSNNKALEIWNNTGAAINLDDYRIAQSVNGGGWAFWHYFPLGSTLADGDVWVILNADCDPLLFDPLNADEVLAYPSVVHHNGDDARGLEWSPDGGTTWVLIDIIGVPDVDPGTGWDVAGVLEATANHTLVRKATVLSGNTDWASAAGTTPDDSEWIVYPIDTFDYLGEHPSTVPGLDPPANLFVTDTGYATWDAPGGGGGGGELYFNDFETDNGGLVSSDPLVWEWGAFLSGPIAGYSGTNGWATVLAANYANSSNATLDTPVSYAITSAGAMLEFWHWYQIETSWDGGNVKISNDAGATWTVITPLTGYSGTANTSNPLNGEPIFTGYGQQFWELAQFDLSAYVGQSVMFRWHFGSDSSVSYPGWYIDDVTITDGGATENILFAASKSKADNSRAFLDQYKVYLDGVLVAGPVSDLFYQFDTATLVNGQTYLAGVSALYDEGESDPIEYPFTYVAPTLDPPTNLNVTNSGYATWDAPTDGVWNFIRDNMLSYKKANSRTSLSAQELEMDRLAHSFSNIESRDFLGYNVYLDGVLVVFTANQYYQYTGLVEGQNYLAEVTAVYDEGESVPATFNFTYQPSALNPPQNLDVTQAAYATWDPPAGGGTGDIYWSDFESDNGGWVATASWDPTGDWQWTNSYNVANYTGVYNPPPTAYSGTGMWGTLLYADYTNSGGYSYLSQTFDFSNVTDATISFWYWAEMWGTWDYCELWVNGDVVFYVDSENPFWQFAEIDLALYSGLPAVNIEFAFYATTVVNRAGMYIDDVLIAGSGGGGGGGGTVQVDPQAVPYWTGSTDGATLTYNSLVRGWNLEDGWMMFDVSAIPDGSTITEIEFNGYVNDTNWPYWDLNGVSVNPLTATPAALYADIQTNTYNSYMETSTFAPGWKIDVLGGTANADLAAALTQDWFCLGINSTDNSTTYYIVFDGWNETNSPFLNVTYEDIDGVVATHKARLINPNNENSRAFLGQYNVYLDGVLVAGAITDEFYQFDTASMVVGQTYTAGVSALYDEGESDAIYESFVYSDLEPEIVVTPASINETLEPNQIVVVPLTISNPGGAELIFDITIIDTSDGDRREDNNIRVRRTNVSRNAEEAPRVTYATGAMDDLWDDLLVFDVDTPSGQVGLAGMGWDGTYFYAHKWSASNQTFKFDADGNYIGPVTLPLTGCRDSAFDGTYMYGSPATSTVSSWDPPTGTANPAGNIIVAGASVRAVAYDSTTDTFWSGNWGDNIVNWNRSGTILNSYPWAGSLYGLAFEDCSEGTFLYAHSQDPGCVVYRLNAAANLAQLATFDATSLGAAGAIAGGAEAMTDWDPTGLRTLAILLQGTPDYIAVLELGAGDEPWISVDTIAGSVPPGGSQIVNVTLNAEDLSDITKTADIVIANNAGTDVIVPVTMNVNPLIVIPLPPNNFAGVVQNFNDVLLTWEPPGGATEEIYYHSGYDNNGIGTTGVADWICAARFTADELAAYYGGWSITGVNIFLHSMDFSYVGIQVYEGGSFGNPGTLVYDQDITASATALAFTNHLLSTPIPLVAGNEYWIGYEMSATGDHPAAVDAGPAVAGKGDWMYFNSIWQEISVTFSLNYNWVINGVVTQSSDIAANTSPSTKVIGNNNRALEPRFSERVNNAVMTAAYNRPVSKNQSAFASTNSRALTGYTVYRDGTEIGSVAAAILQYVDSGLDAGTYNYTIIANYDEGDSDPAGPVGITITLPGPASVTGTSNWPNILIQWTAPSRSRAVESYNVYQGTTFVANTTSSFLLHTNVPAGTYTYNVAAVYTGGHEGDWTASNVINHEEPSNTDPNLIPMVTELNGNYPNPFNPTTNIKFGLSQNEFVNLVVYNIKGEKVCTLIDNEMEAGYHNVLWNGRDDSGKVVSSGVYFYKMRAGTYTSTRKMILMK